MKFLHLILFLVIVVSSTFCQKNSLTTFSDSLDLYKLDKYSGNFYLRIWTERQIVDIWQRDSSDLFPGGYSVKLINWTSDYFSDNNDEFARTYKMEDSYWSWQANKTKYLIDSIDIIKLISSIDKNNLQSYVDPNTLIFELKNSTGYNYYNLSNAKEQLNVSDAEKIVVFIDKLSELLNMKKYWEEFIEQIPVECYNNGGVITTCKTLSKKEKRLLKKRRNKLPLTLSTFYRGVARN
ncbi:MAG: hypothetical protein CMD31_05915 [Flavobacteriales bacterium]|nr:hypothetical protein [Flavobacteriales bacterium]|tara:strand:+ start:107299 stop:108009 length:711 start_codon:yes stop_codon:yes gene_type:complete